MKDTDLIGLNCRGHLKPVSHILDLDHIKETWLTGIALFNNGLIIHASGGRIGEYTVNDNGNIEDICIKSTYLTQKEIDKK